MISSHRRAARVVGAASALLALASLVLSAPASTHEPPRVVRVELHGAIDVASAAFLRRALQIAEGSGASALVVEINTPGGLLGPMEEMVRTLLAARVATVVYVAPAGGHAWSAGAVVTMAAAIAAMDPATSIGAAHPVSLIPGAEHGDEKRPAAPLSDPSRGGHAPASGPAPASQLVAGRPAAVRPPAERPSAERPSAERPPAERSTAERPSAERSPAERPSAERPETQKLLNAMSEQARVIARARGRDEDFAVRMVRESATLGADEAVRHRVVDLTARSLDELLTRIDGRTVAIAGHSEVLRTAGARVETITPTFKERFLHVLNDPNILLVLIALASLGLLFELQTPGVVLPGVIGGIALLLALYSLAVLPVSWAGLGLLLFGIVLLIVDVKYPTHGVLTVGGLGSFVLGALMLVDTSLAPALRVSWYVVLGTALAFAAFFVFAMGAAARAHRRPVAMGPEALVGARGVARSALTPTGSVLVSGELWQARADEPIDAGDPVVVLSLERLTLTVRRAPLTGDGGAPNSAAKGGTT
jgi:membrane-bound serine protease (ClpP class)